MTSLGEVLDTLLRGLGLPGLLIAIFLIFMVDAAVIPALPEVFIIAFYVQYGTLGVEPFPWAVALLITAVAGEICGNGIIYTIVSRLLVKKQRMPRIIDRAVKGWANFLIVKQEKVILANRVAPAVPLIGIFIAVCGWNVKKSFSYIIIGSLVKYSFLLALVGYLNIVYDPHIAQWLTIVAVLIVVALSVIAALVRRKQLRKAQAIGKKT